ncbi:MAG TPA: glycosyltransferase family 1 protein [Acidimicrobiales bacterium]|nr:glycosyltransferase family 1 protein [Acidimicrobiales bacterium]
MTRPLRVLVDGRVMCDAYHGIGRHIFALLHELGPRDLEITVVTPTTSGRLDLTSLLRYESVRFVGSDVPVVSLRSQWELARLVARERPDILFVPYHLSTPLLHGRTPVLSVVHDCIFERRAEQSGERSAFLFAYRASTRLALRSSSVVATVSEATRKDLRHFYGVELPSEAVLPHGVGKEFFRARRLPRPAELELPERYALHVGVRRPHKNQQLLVRALQHWSGAHPELGLVMVGAQDPRYPDTVGRLVEDRGLQSQVRRFEHVSEQQLLALYGNASVFAYPSVAEGFGLPLLEAMAAGIPVVASDAEAVQEASEGAVMTLSPEGPDKWADAITQVVYDAEVSDPLRRFGVAVAEKHSWAGSADRTLRLLSAAASRRKVEEPIG